jgi:hypothetical protein
MIGIEYNHERTVPVKILPDGELFKKFRVISGVKGSWETEKTETTLVSQREMKEQFQYSGVL